MMACLARSSSATLVSMLLNNLTSSEASFIVSSETLRVCSYNDEEQVLIQDGKDEEKAKISTEVSVSMSDVDEFHFAIPYADNEEEQQQNGTNASAMIVLAAAITEVRCETYGARGNGMACVSRNESKQDASALLDQELPLFPTCEEMRCRYGVVSGKSWGSLGEEKHAMWAEQGCDATNPAEDDCAAIARLTELTNRAARATIDVVAPAAPADTSAIAAVTLAVAKNTSFIS